MPLEPKQPEIVAAAPSLAPSRPATLSPKPAEAVVDTSAAHAIATAAAKQRAAGIQALDAEGQRTFIEAFMEWIKRLVARLAEMFGLRVAGYGAAPGSPGGVDAEAQQRQDDTAQFSAAPETLDAEDDVPPISAVLGKIPPGGSPFGVRIKPTGPATVAPRVAADMIEQVLESAAQYLSADKTLREEHLRDPNLMEDLLRSMSKDHDRLVAAANEAGEAADPLVDQILARASGDVPSRSALVEILGDAQNNPQASLLDPDGRASALLETRIRALSMLRTIEVAAAALVDGAPPVAGQTLTERLRTWMPAAVDLLRDQAAKGTQATSSEGAVPQLNAQDGELCNRIVVSDSNRDVPGAPASSSASSAPGSPFLMALSRGGRLPGAAHGVLASDGARTDAMLGLWSDEQRRTGEPPERPQG